MQIKIKHLNKDFECALILGLIIGVFLLPAINNFVYGSSALLLDLVSIFIFPLVSAAGLFFSKIIFAKNKALLQFIKFALIGVANTAINIGVFNFFVNATGITSGLPLVIISTVSFFSAVVNSYIWNTHWSFEEGFTNTVYQFEKFFLITFISLLVNDIAIIIVISLFNGAFAPKELANIANIVGILLSMCSNFTGYKYIVFNKRK
ncbi:MAG: putative rane protein [Candidatus Doudnabacteria bacterium]|nr:putative rane protein [Candidatus Doudnabacteria bacterium]